MHGSARTGRSVVAALVDALYADLRRISSAYLRREDGCLTLQTTELVHEAYLRLAGQRNVAGMDELSFRAATANVIRRILVEHARARNRLKRGSQRTMTRVPLDIIADTVSETCSDPEALDQALARLEVLSVRQSRVVELRFFGGLEFELIADILKVSRRTVERDWTFARAWLRDELEK